MDNKDTGAIRHGIISDLSALANERCCIGRGERGVGFVIERQWSLAWRSLVLLLSAVPYSFLYLILVLGGGRGSTMVKTLDSCLLLIKLHPQNACKMSLCCVGSLCTMTLYSRGVKYLPQPPRGKVPVSREERQKSESLQVPGRWVMRARRVEVQVTPGVLPVGRSFIPASRDDTL